MWLESIGLGVVIFFMLLGFLGSFVPLMPGPLLGWLAVLVYEIATHFTVIQPLTFAIMTLIALIAATADVWMSILGAKTLGASGRSIIWGIGGAVVGFVVLNLPGALVGYALGILYSEYRKCEDWRVAFKASVGGLAGWGLSTVVQAAGALLLLIIFVWQVLIK